LEEEYKELYQLPMLMLLKCMILKWINGLCLNLCLQKSGISAASVDNTIYVFGGEDITKTYNNNEKYDVKKNKWEYQESLSTARHGLSAVSVND
jgi:hypothetical protein